MKKAQLQETTEYLKANGITSPEIGIVLGTGLGKLVDEIDIEGHEDKALVPFLLNSSETLLPKKIVIEKLSKNSDYPGCLMAFEKLNYKLVSRSKNNSHYEHFTRGK